MKTTAKIVAVGIALAARISWAAPTPLENDVTRALRPALRGGLEIVRVELPQGWRSIKHAELAVEGPMPERAGTGWVRVTLKGAHAQTGYVRVEVGAAQAVVELTHPLRAGDTIDDAALRPNTRLLKDGEHPVGDPRALVGRKVSRDLDVGSTVMQSDLVAEVQVPRGTPVKVIAKRGNVRVVAQAVLERAAVPGEETQARVLETHLLVAGRLIDRNTVINEGM